MHAMITGLRLHTGECCPAIRNGIHVVVGGTGSRGELELGVGRPCHRLDVQLATYLPWSTSILLTNTTSLFKGNQSLLHL